MENIFLKRQSTLLVCFVFRKYSYLELFQESLWYPSTLFDKNDLVLCVHPSSRAGANEYILNILYYIDRFQMNLNMAGF